MFNFQEDDIFYSVLERKMNAVAATYQLLEKRFESGQNLVGVPTVGQRHPPHREFRDYNQREKTDGTAKMNGELPAIPKETSSLIASKPSVNLFKYSSSKYSEYKPREVTRNVSLKRRNKMRLDKHMKTEDEIGVVPDFILTYAHNDQIEYEIPDRRYEWEPSFIVTKHGSMKSAKINQTSQNQSNNSVSHSISDDAGKNVKPTREINAFGRRNQLRTPANSIADEEINHAKSISGETMISDKASTILSCEDPYNEKVWSTYNRQKSRLARGMSLTVKRDHSLAYKAPFSAPKALSPRDAKSYFQEIANARVIGTGKNLH